MIDLGSTHSYICIEQLSDKLPSVEPLAYDMLVTSPLGHSVRVNRVYKNCPLIVHDREFSVDLIALPFLISVHFLQRTDSVQLIIVYISSLAYF